MLRVAEPLRRSASATTREDYARRMIQLAPPELQQPERPAGTPAKMETATRTWTDSTGKFKVDAALVNVSDGKVNLRRSDGRTMSIPLERLSDADQAHVKELQQPAAENPFQLN